ncbi:MAG: J domain-containing protein [Chloroflexota bacterium]|nr:MAG: J domain-containing protein [Chloroflexota bacterium]
MEYRDYYATLGVKRDASQAEIKKAFRRLARKYHPDVNTADAAAERRFKEINEANEVLGDPQKRGLYDRLGSDWEQIQHAQQAGSQQRRRSGAGGGPAAGRAGFEGFSGYAAGGAGPGVRFEFRGDPEDLAGFSDFFQTFFGANMAGAASPGRGRTATATGDPGSLDFEAVLAGLGLDGTGGSASGPSARRASPRTAPLERQHLEAQADISLEEAYAGTSRLVQIAGKRLEVTIPRGVRTGQRIRLSGKAGSGPGAGNVYLDVSVRVHPVFAREGDDLRRELPLSLAEAMLGAEVPVGTLKGGVRLKIPAGTQNGRVFRLAGQGLPHFRAEGFGDLFVKVRVVLPTAFDAEGRHLFAAFAEHVQQPDPRAAPGPGPSASSSGANPS